MYFLRFLQCITSCDRYLPFFSGVFFLLLLLRSPATSLEFTILVRFLHMWPFFNPTIEVVTFCLHGWCMLGLLLLPAFTCLGHEHQDLFESVWWIACVRRLALSLYSHPKEFWGSGVRTHVISKGKIPSTGKILFREGSNPRRCIKQDSKPNTLPTSHSGPPFVSLTALTQCATFVALPVRHDAPLEWLLHMSHCERCKYKWKSFMTNQNICCDFLLASSVLADAERYFGSIFTRRVCCRKRFHCKPLF